MATLDNERFYPRPPDLVFLALQVAVEECRCKITRTDDFSMTLNISSPASGFSWGAKMSAQVRPAEGGSIVRVDGATRIRANLTAPAAERKKVGQILDMVSEALQGRIS